MKTVGQILHDARESKGLTVAQAVEGTRSQSQVILALEQDDFSRFPAPIYTRGFIKLYAEFLGLDASELISLYQARNADADKLHRPSSVLRPGSSHPPPPPAGMEMTPELGLPPPAPISEPAEKTPKPEVAPPAPVSRPAMAELELPFDKPAPPPEPKPVPRPAPSLFPPPPPPPAMAPPTAPLPSKLPPSPDVPKVLPPKVAPSLPEAPRMPVPSVAGPPAPPPGIPRAKVSLPKPVPKSGGTDEFSLEVREGSLSSTARARAASIFSLARDSAIRLPWGKILTRSGVVIGALLMMWLFLSVIRGCVNRHHAAAVRIEESATPYSLPPVPEPPPLYFPDSLPRR